MLSITFCSKFVFNISSISRKLVVNANQRSI